MSHVVVQKLGEWHVASTSPGGFLTSVGTGYPSRKVAQQEADRLNNSGKSQQAAHMKDRRNSHIPLSYFNTRF